MMAFMKIQTKYVNLVIIAVKHVWEMNQIVVYLVTVMHLGN